MPVTAQRPARRRRHGAPGIVARMGTLTVFSRSVRRDRDETPHASVYRCIRMHDRDHVPLPSNAPRIHASSGGSSRIATTSNRTFLAPARAGFSTSHLRAARITRSLFRDVTASAGVPRASFRRHFTSTKTSVGPSSATRSISPSRYLTLRPRRTRPFSSRCLAAASSPPRPASTLRRSFGAAFGRLRRAIPSRFSRAFQSSPSEEFTTRG